MERFYIMQNNGEMILYTTDDGLARITLKTIDNTVWLSQAEMAVLFDTSKQNISLHIQHVFQEDELFEEAVVKDYLTTANDGKNYLVKLYHLDMILAVGYRIRSPRGVQFRRWATTVLREYLVKGFVLDTPRLKEPEGFDYFDELLEKIRDIRASEKRFYQKVTDIFSTSVDYDGGSETAQLFFKTIQNKLLFAVTGQTAAELITQRANAQLPTMGLTNWKGSVVRKGDIAISKNYLAEEELKRLNLLVSAFLENAQLRAENRKSTTMQEWQTYVDKVLALNELTILKNAGRVSHEQMLEQVTQCFDAFETNRQEQAKQRAELAYEKTLEAELTRLIDKRKQSLKSKQTRKKPNHLG